MRIALTEAWGMTDREFAAWYIGLGAVFYVALLVFGGRSRSRRKPPAGAACDLGLYELAMVNGGPQLAITTAATRLHRLRVLAGGQVAGTHVVHGALPPDAHALEREMFATVRAEPRLSSARLRHKLEHGDAIAALRSGLAATGLIVSAPRRSWLFALGVLALLGIVRAEAAPTDMDAALRMLAGFVCINLAAGVTMLVPARSSATFAGLSAVAARQEDQPELRERPAHAEGALAAALFGAGALWIADPAIAAALNVPREASSLGDRRGGDCGGCSLDSGGADGGCGCGCGGCG